MTEVSGKGRAGGRGGVAMVSGCHGDGGCGGDAAKWAVTPPPHQWMWLTWLSETSSDLNPSVNCWINLDYF